MYEFEDIVCAVTSWFKNSKDKQEFIETEKLTKYHNSLGRNIRNDFKLWDTEWRPMIVDGIDRSEDHPDQVSMRVIEEVHKRLKEKVNV